MFWWNELNTSERGWIVVCILGLVILGRMLEIWKRRGHEELARTQRQLRIAYTVKRLSTIPLDFGHDHAAANRRADDLLADFLIKMECGEVAQAFLRVRHDLRKENSPDGSHKSSHRPNQAPD